MLCDEIGILDDGSLLACGTLQQLLHATAGHALMVTLTALPTAQQRAALNAIAGIDYQDNEIRLDKCSENDLKRIIAILTIEGLGIDRMQYGYGNLEELFLHLTGRQLKD